MDQALRLTIEKTLKKETNNILIEIEKMIKKDGMERILKTGKPGGSQFKTLMDAAGEAACVEELFLFLSYQSSKTDGWGKGLADNKSIAEAVIISFKNVQEKIFESVKKAGGMEKIAPEDERILSLETAKKYFGYLYWRVSIVKRENKDENEDKNENKNKRSRR